MFDATLFLQKRDHAVTSAEDLAREDAAKGIRRWHSEDANTCVPSDIAPFHAITVLAYCRAWEACAAKVAHPLLA